MPTLLTSVVTKPIIPKQDLKTIKLDKKTKNSSIISIVTGSLAGILVSIIPGITSSTGTILAMNARGESNKKQTIATLSAVNTACSFFVVVVLFIISRSRSGATLAVMELITIEEWSMLSIPSSLCYLLIALLLSGTLSYYFTIYIGRLFAKHFEKAPYQLIIGLTIALIFILVFLFTGLMGIFILIIATIIGFLPVQWGVRRSHCMGILLIPIILYYL